MIAHYSKDRHRPNAERTAAWRTQWLRLHSEPERECIARAGQSVKDRWAQYAATRARHARIPPKHWPRIAAALEAVTKSAQGIVDRNVVQMRRRKA